MNSPFTRISRSSPPGFDIPSALGLVQYSPINIQISLTPGQVVTDVCQALEYSTWKAHVHINQRIPTSVSKELLSEDILRMAHTVHSVPLTIFRAQGPPDSLLSSCDPPFWCHGFFLPWGYSDSTFVEITSVSHFLLILYKYVVLLAVYWKSKQVIRHFGGQIKQRSRSKKLINFIQLSLLR